MLVKALFTLYTLAELGLGAAGFALSTRDATTTVSQQLNTAFTSAYWIWIPEANFNLSPAEDVALRKTFVSPSGKTATDATVVMTADNLFTLFVNGQPIGGSPNISGYTWENALKFAVALNATTNTFAVRATNQFDSGPNGEGSAGLLGAVEVHYSDGSSDIFTTDSSWKSRELIPWNFQLAEYDDSSWANAGTIDKYGAQPWGTSVVMETAQPVDLSLTNAQWIWARNGPSTQAAFRRQVSPPSGKVSMSANIIVAADSDFKFYLNGQLLGSAPNSPNMWAYPQRFEGITLDTHLNLFAAAVTHDPSRGTSSPGFIAAIETFYNDKTSDVLYTDSTWLSIGPIPQNYELAETDDSSWAAASSAGLFNTAPWNGNVHIVDALAASLANTSATDPNSPRPPPPSATDPTDPTNPANPTSAVTAAGPPGTSGAFSITPNLLALSILFMFYVVA